MNKAAVNVSRHEWRDTKNLAAWRIVVTTHNLNCYAAIVHRPKGERLTEFEARTIWKNERGLFRLLEEVK